MGVYSESALSLYASTDLNGNARGPNMERAQKYHYEIERVIDAIAAAGGVLYTTLAAMNADLAHDAATPALLIGESSSDDGIYVKSGASGAGSWTRVADLPGYSYVVATNAGAGTADAIQVTTALPVNGSQLITVPIVATTTSSTVTISFNGDTAVTVKTQSGNNPDPGGLVATSEITGRLSGTEFRMISDQASTAIQAAAEANAGYAQEWANKAEDSLVSTEAGGDGVDDYSALHWARKAQAAVAGNNVPDINTGDRDKTLFVKPDESGYELLTNGFVHAGHWLTSSGAQDANMTSAITSAAATTEKILFVPEGTYEFVEEVDFSTLNGVILGGDIVFDFTGADTTANFPNGGHIYVGGGALTALPDLSTDADAGDVTLVFDSDPSLSNGDIFCIYDPTNGSFHGSRNEYRKGEWCHVSDGTGGATVELSGSLYDDYTAATVEVYKHPAKTFSVSGSGTLTILESEHTNLNGAAGFRADLIVNSDFSKIHPTNSGYAGFVLKQCVGITGTGYRSRQHRYTTGGVYYGLIYANCQDINIQGSFTGGRYGVSGGGFDDTGCVPNRNCVFTGTFRNSADAALGIGAVNWHGNCEYCSYFGRIDGGVTGGGNHNSAAGSTIIAPLGIAYYASEMVGHDFDFTNTTIFAYGNPGSGVNAVLDIGADSVAMDADTRFGGKMKFDGAKVIAPDARFLAIVKNRGYVGTEDAMISLNGVTWESTGAANPFVISISTVTGNDLTVAFLADIHNGPNASYSIGGSTKVRGFRASGSTVLTPPSTSVSFVDVAVSLKAPKAPDIVLGSKNHLLGDQKWIANTLNVTTTGFTLRGQVYDGVTNFSSTNAGTLSWHAVLDEH